jgi:predicted dinucleotide-binding enzyme
MTKIGILGSGAVAKSLGNGFIKYGYKVMLGTRDISKLSEWKEKAGSNAQIGGFEETAKFGEIIVLAVLGNVATEVVELAGPQNLNGKTVIDTTNPIDEVPPQDGVIKYFTKTDESLMEILQERFPAAHFVKAFNSVGNTFMVNPTFKEGKPTMFICGNNENSKSEVSAILDKFGWEIEDMGKATAARAIEPLCVLWCIPGFLRNQWSHAFKLLKA